MDNPIRIGAVNYLNTKPLICDLDLLAPDAELILDVPSRLADLLAAGELDVALIPSSNTSGPARYSHRAEHRHRLARPGAERDAVQPRALGRDSPRGAGRRLAHQRRPDADPAAQALRRRRRRSCRCRWTQRAEDVDADAVLLIGDRAMRACLPGFAHAFDLGQEWHDWTGLPFVYAVWAVREGVDLGPVDAALVEAKRRGLRQHRADRPPRGAAAWDWTPASAAATLPTSSTLTWGRANRPGCIIITCWPASWAWPAGG